MRRWRVFWTCVQTGSRSGSQPDVPTSRRPDIDAFLAKARLPEKKKWWRVPTDSSIAEAWEETYGWRKCAPKLVFFSHIFPGVISRCEVTKGIAPEFAPELSLGFLIQSARSFENFKQLVLVVWRPLALNSDLNPWRLWRVNGKPTISPIKKTRPRIIGVLLIFRS